MFGLLGLEGLLRGSAVLLSLSLLAYSVYLELLCYHPSRLSVFKVCILGFACACVLLLMLLLLLLLLLLVVVLFFFVVATSRSP
jgi:hypothetical protein